MSPSSGIHYLKFAKLLLKLFDAFILPHLNSQRTCLKDCYHGSPHLKIRWLYSNSGKEQLASFGFTAENPHFDCKALLTLCSSDLENITDSSTLSVASGETLMKAFIAVVVPGLFSVCLVDVDGICSAMPAIESRLCCIGQLDFLLEFAPRLVSRRMLAMDLVMASHYDISSWSANQPK